eukprot:scpid8941/ scgid2891/ Protein FAM179B
MATNVGDGPKKNGALLDAGNLFSSPSPPFLSEEFLERSKTLTRLENDPMSPTAGTASAHLNRWYPNTLPLSLDAAMETGANSSIDPGKPLASEATFIDPDSSVAELARVTGVSSIAPGDRNLSFGFVPADVVRRLGDESNWRRRAEAIEELHMLVSKLPSRNSHSPGEHDVQSLLAFLITRVDDVNFKVGLTALNIVTLLLRNCSSAASAVSASLMDCLSKRLGDSKIVIRQAHMLLLMQLMEVLGADSVIQNILNLSLNSRQWRVREEAINVATAGMLRFPRSDINLEICAAQLAPTLLDCKQRVRQASMEAMAVLAHALGDGNLQPLVAIVSDLERCAVAPELLNAVLARLSRRQMPHFSSDGLVEHSIQVATSSATAARLRGSGADIDWILAAASPNAASRPPSSSVLPSGMATPAGMSATSATPATPASPLSGLLSRQDYTLLDGSDAFRPISTASSATSSELTHVPRPRFSSAGRKQLPWELPLHSSSDPPVSAMGQKREQAHSAPSVSDRLTAMTDEILPPKPPLRSRISWTNPPGGPPAPFQPRTNGGGGGGGTGHPIAVQRRATVDQFDLSTLDEQLAKVGKSSREERPDTADLDDGSTFMPIRSRPSQLQLLEAQALRRAQEQDLRALGGFDDVVPPLPPDIPRLNEWGREETPRFNAKPPPAPKKTSTTASTTASHVPLTNRRVLSKPIKAQQSFGYSGSQADAPRERSSSNADHTAASAITGTHALVRQKDGSTTGASSGTASASSGYSSATPASSGRDSAASTPATYNTSSTFSSGFLSPTQEPTGFLGAGSLLTSDKLPVDKSSLERSSTKSTVPPVRPVTRLGLSPSLQATLARRKQENETERRRQEEESDTGLLDVWPEDTSSCTSLSSQPSEIARESPPSELDDVDMPSSSRHARPPTGRTTDLSASSQGLRKQISGGATTLGMKTPTRSGSQQLSLSMPSPRLLQEVRQASSQSTSTCNDAEQDSEKYEPLVHPSTAVANALKWMDSGEDWEQICTGLRTVRSLAEHHNDVLGKSPQLQIVLLGVVNNVKNLRSSVARLAMRILQDLFVYMTKDMEQCLESTVRVLLQRCGDSSSFLKESAEMAVMKLAQFMHSPKAAAALSNVGKTHRNVGARTATSAALGQVIMTVGVKRSIRSREIMEPSLPVLSVFTKDASAEVRYYARRAINNLMKCPKELKAAGQFLKPADREKLETAIAHIKRKGVGDLPGGRSKRGPLERQLSSESWASTNSFASTDSYTATDSYASSDPFGTADALASTRSVKLPLGNASQGTHGAMGTLDGPGPMVGARAAGPTSRIIRQHTTGGSGGGPLPSAIIANLVSTDSKARDNALGDLSDLAKQKPAVITQHAIKIFDAFTPRLNDANSKVALRALTCLNDLFALASVVDVWPRVAKALMPAIFSALASRHASIRSSADKALQHAIAAIDGMVLLPMIASIAQFGNKSVKAQAIGASADAFDSCYEEYPKTATRSVLPVVWHSASLLAGKVSKATTSFAPVSPALKLAAAKLIHIVFDRIEDTLITSARQQLTGEEVKILNGILEHPPPME